MIMGSSPFPKWLFLFLLHALLLLSTTTRTTTTTTESSSSSFPYGGNDDLIQATCKITSNFNLCIKTLESDPRSLKSDVKGLANITLDIALTKTNETLYFVGELFKNTTDPLLSRLLGTCIEEYRKAVEETLPQAISDLGSNNYGASKQGADDAATDAMVCEQQLFGEKSPVDVWSELVKQLCSIASSIISTLH